MSRFLPTAIPTWPQLQSILSLFRLQSLPDTENKSPQSPFLEVLRSHSIICLGLRSLICGSQATSNPNYSTDNVEGRWTQLVSAPPHLLPLSWEFSSFAYGGSIESHGWWVILPGEYFISFHYNTIIHTITIYILGLYVSRHSVERIHMIEVG